MKTLETDIVKKNTFTVNRKILFCSNINTQKRETAFLLKRQQTKVFSNHKFRKKNYKFNVAFPQK